MTGALRSMIITGALVAGATVLTFGVGAPPENCPDITVADAEMGATAAADWLIDNQLPDGTWLYEYDRVTDEASDDYNIVRHAGVMMSLYQAATYGIPGAHESADRGLEWALDNVVERHGWAGVTTTSTIQAGTNALMLAGLAERRLATGDDTHDEFMRSLGQFLVDQVEPNGALLAYYDLEPDQPRADTYSIYYTGEAYWGLGRLHNQEPDAGWGTTADLMGAYMATERDEAEDVWPPLADHWSGYGLAETAAFPERTVGEPLTDDELAFLQRQGGLIGQRVRSISQRYGPWGPLVRGTFTPRGGGYGVFGEGLAGLWRAAELDDRLSDERSPLADRATCITGLAIEAQDGPDEAARYASPGKVEGAWFIDDITRMDDQQHAMSALLTTIPILEAGAGESGGHPAPPTWLWLAVVVTVINPLRAAFGVPRGGDRATRAPRALVGSAIGAGILLLVGATSGWILDAADASLPSMRVAAAGLCLISATIDMFRRPTAPDAPLDGWRGALVPITVPLFVRPAMVLTGLAVVADLGLAAYGGGLTVAVLALTGLAGVPTETYEHSVLAKWGVRMIAAIAIVGSILLGVDAVFDI